MVSRAKWLLCALTCLLAVLTTATFAQAAVQTPKNGCSSDVAYEGSLTSPAYTPTSPDINTPPNVDLEGWFEVEGVDPVGHDTIVLEYDEPSQGFFTEFARLNPGSATGGNADQPFSNNGLSVSPSYQAFNFQLPLSTRGVAGVQVRIHFISGDGAFQGFRGAGVDEVTLEASPAIPTQTFETGLGTWTADSAGPGEPFWQVIDDSQNVTVKNPEVNPTLVTLPDSGSLPATPFGTKFAWFGNIASGTYCGPDFANVLVEPPPPAADTFITSAPPDSTPSKDASFSFSGTDAVSFQCQLDGAAFAACASPRSYTGLANGTHTFAVRVIDSTGTPDPTPATRTWTIREATLADLPNPVQGVSVNVDQVSGTVRVGIPGAAAGSRASAHASQKGINFVPLSEARQIPVGSFLDTRKGTVRLQSAANQLGKRQTGTFLQSLFQVRQSKKRSARGLTDLVLKGSSFRRCRARSGNSASAALSRRAIRRLRASARGRFRTSGRNSSATVRGTKWDITDRCDGTLTKVRRGRVVVRDFRRRKNIVLTSGKSYLARPRG
jgi:hypothetical protein